MANTPRTASLNLAENLANLRAKRGLTQNALARIAGVPRSTVTHLESGAGNPSLHNLARVAGALQVTIEELLATPRASCKLVRAGDVPSVKRSQGVATVYKLLPDPIPGMEIDRMEFVVGGRMGGIPHVAGTKEYLAVVSGEITVHVAGQSYRVGEGDVLAFPGDQAHSYQNTGTRRAVGFSVVALAPAGF
jgi:transcriptional regulator with XRE-family HTH domain